MKKNIQLSIFPFFLLIATIVYAIIKVSQFAPAEELVGNKAWAGFGQGIVKLTIYIGIIFSLSTLGLIWFSSRFRLLVSILNIIIVITAFFICLN